MSGCQCGYPDWPGQCPGPRYCPCVRQPAHCESCGAEINDDGYSIDDRACFYCRADQESDMRISDELTRLRARVETLAEDGQFLLDRLAEVEVPDETAREWFGHVEPAAERFRAALASVREKADG